MSEQKRKMSRPGIAHPKTTVSTIACIGTAWVCTGVLLCTTLAFAALYGWSLDQNRLFRFRETGRTAAVLETREDRLVHTALYTVDVDLTFENVIDRAHRIRSVTIPEALVLRTLVSSVSFEEVSDTVVLVLETSKGRVRLSSGSKGYNFEPNDQFSLQHAGVLSLLGNFEPSHRRTTTCEADHADILRECQRRVAKNDVLLASCVLTCGRIYRASCEMLG